MSDTTIYEPPGGFGESQLVPEPELDRHGLRDDVGNAARFARDHAERLRHVEAFSPSWLVWDGRRWAHDETNAHVEFAKLTADALWLERGQDEDKEWRAFAAASRRAGRLNAMLSLAKSDPRLARRAAGFDTDPWLLNVRRSRLDSPDDPQDGRAHGGGGAS